MVFACAYVTMQVGRTAFVLWAMRGETPRRVRNFQRIGAWLGTIMLFNVWVFIWPNQKKVLGLVEATADQIAKARKVATLASRTNTMLSIPMLMGMAGAHHGYFI